MKRVAERSVRDRVSINAGSIEIGSARSTNMQKATVGAGASRCRKRGVAFSREKTTKIFSLRLTPSDIERLRYLKEVTEAESLTEVILNALAAYDMTIEYLESGHEVVIRIRKEVV